MSCDYDVVPSFLGAAAVERSVVFGAGAFDFGGVGVEEFFEGVLEFLSNGVCGFGVEDFDDVFDG